VSRECNQGLQTEVKREKEPRTLCVKKDVMTLSTFEKDEGIRAPSKTIHNDWDKAVAGIGYA